MASQASDSNIDDPLSCGRLTIDLDAYAENWCFLRDKVNEGKSVTECAAMVKADAYGISIKKAVTSLTARGCKIFFVATPQEGIEVKKTNSLAVVYILNGLLPSCTRSYLNNGLRPVLNTIEEVEEWSSHGQKAPAALHIDTGMNRLGLSEAQATDLSNEQNLLSELNLTLIMSHLACGDTPKSLMNGCQLSSFNTICALFPKIKRSLCNSSGIFNGKAFHLDMVRPGIALYGGTALTEHTRANPMKPVVKAEARILQIREVKEHESIGYGAAEIIQDQSRIAILSAGYADGYLRQAGSTNDLKGAQAYLRGHYLPLVGRVSMDLIAVDISNVPDASRGDYVELFGPNISISEVASHAKTIDYEFLTGLGKRYSRIYSPLGD